MWIIQQTLQQAALAGDPDALYALVLALSTRDAQEKRYLVVDKDFVEGEGIVTGELSQALRFPTREAAEAARAGLYKAYQEGGYEVGAEPQWDVVEVAE